jgi:hypothetical protein
MSKRLLRSVAYAVSTLAAVAMVYLMYLHGSYADRMPQAPQPQTGRAHAVFVMRSTRYVSEREASRLHVAESVAAACWAVAFATFAGIAYLQYRRTGVLPTKRRSDDWTGL